MTDKMFDKFVSDKLRDHPSPVPSGLWEKIERHKGKEPKTGILSRTALWAGIFIIAASVGIGVYLNKAKDNTNDITRVNKNSPAANGNVIDKTAGMPSSSNGESANNNQLNPEIGNETPAGRINNATTNNSSQNNDAPPIVKNGLGDFTEEKPNDNNKARINDSRYYGSTGRRSNSNAAVRRTNSNKVVSKTNNQTFTVAPIDEDAMDPTPVLTSANRISLTNRTTVYNLRSLAKTNTDQQFNLSDLSIVRIDCPPSGNERRNDWYLEVYGSPDFVTKSVSGGNTTFVSKKDSTESQQLSYTAGFRISKSIGENLLLKTGLQYSQINERFDLRTENERRIITVVTIRTIPGSNGADSTISDTSTVEQIGYRLQRSYNRYRSIDVPVLLSYEFGNPNLRFAINAGAIINIRSWYTGNALNDSMMVVSINSKGNGAYKQNIGLGAYAGFSIMKPIADRWDLMVEPYFRYNFSNMSRSEGYTQKFQVFGINLGLRYKLKGQRAALK